MNVLVIRAHPLEANRSRSMSMADAFVGAYTERSPEARVTEMRLYEQAVPEIDLDLLTGWASLREGEHFAHLSGAQQNKLTLFDTYTRQFLESDLVVIANPLWNLSVPTRLKAWIDTVVVAGKTFRYTESGAAEGLATGKTVVHLQASGGHFDMQDPACQYIKGLFSFLGCQVHQLAAEGMDHEPHRAEEIMTAALAAAAELGRTV